MALAYRPEKEEIIQSIINGVKDGEAVTDDGSFFCLDFTSFCSGNCYYCAKSRDNWDLKRSRMTAEEILEGLKAAYESGTRNFLLYGGMDLYFDREKISDIVRKIKTAYPDCLLYLAVGEKVTEDYLAYKEAGADGFALFHKTANEDHFARLHSMEYYPDFRKKMLPFLRDMGFRIGTGITVGWPYQTAEILAEDVAFLMELEPDLVVIDAFVPEKGTEFEGFRKGDRKQQENLVKLVRKIFPDIPILTHL
ncbi:MAG: radical SAM protein [Firmicutes bacterium]|nr:radical SAM protein [Bacillota bacterium]